jgi:transcriptional regulator with XRE-family HTH domain
MDMPFYALCDMDTPDAVLRMIGGQMKRARENASLTQGHVSRRMGAEIDQPRVSKWESGAAPPSLVQLFRYAEVCGVAPEELVAGIVKPLTQQPALFRDLDPPTTRLVTNLVSLLRERAGLMGARRERVRRSG